MACRKHSNDFRASCIILVYCMILINYQAIASKSNDDAEDAEEGGLRLTGGSKEGSGRLEVYHDNQWGTICSDYWDIDDTAVVCRQLGYSAAIRFATQTGDNSKPTWLDNVRCDGVEGDLVDCAHNGWGTSNCKADHSEDVFVECQVGGMDGDVCLRTNDDEAVSESAGFVHIWSGNKWRKVCDPNWGFTESTIVCRQLGLIAATYHDISDNVTASHDVVCSGTEDKLTDCKHLDWHDNCKEAVTVSCSTTIPDSAAEALHDPEKYCRTEFKVNDLPGNETRTQATLDIIRESLGICNGVVPADMKCSKEGVSYKTDDIVYGHDQFPGTVCHRRIGFACEESQQDCKTFNVSVLCPCVKEDNRENNTVQQAICKEGLEEYSVGEKRFMDDCVACTCSSSGSFSCDNDDNFCKKKGPPPFESICYRPCENPPQPKTCDLGQWNVEWFIGGNSPFCVDCLYDDLQREAYPTNPVIHNCPDCIPLDGIPRAVAVINRKLPGPAVHVCEGDTVIVKVINRMTKEPAMGTTIHWHGMFMEGTPYMDGAFMVTQCPIPIGEAFIYNFKANPHGTHWWHSHAGLQRGDGLFGALIVRQAKDVDVNGDEYDIDIAEHTVILQDWLHHVGVNSFNRDFYGGKDFDSLPGSILINGRGGQQIDPKMRPDWCGKSITDPQECPVPKYAQFDVIPNKRHRFRVISTSVARDCGIQVSIDQHNLRIIATDGAPTKPFDTKSFVLFSADRIDFVLDADKPVGDYLMRIKGLHTCKHLPVNHAIIHYNSTSAVTIPESSDDSDTGVKVDPCDSNGDFNEEGKFLGQLDSHPDVPAPDWTEPDETFYLELNFADENLHGLPRINNVTFRLPSIPFLLQSEFPKEKLEMCNHENDAADGYDRMHTCGEGHCECSHIINVEQGKVVELFFINHELSYSPSSACHPMHLHGVNFRVVAEQSFDADIAVSAKFVRELNENGTINRKSVKDAIAKDTMVAPENGFTAVQFRADNPGYWYLHCHFEEHLALGMVVVLHVEGEIPERPENYPECGGDWPTPRANDGEAYIWSESLLGSVDASQPIFKAVTETVEQSNIALQERFNRKFAKFEVTNNRLKTDPVTGYHYYLFKIHTGNEWFIHVQFRAPTMYDTKRPKVVLVACQDSFSEDEPLLPMKVNTPENRCKPPVKKVVCSSKSAGSSTHWVFSVLHLFPVLLSVVLGTLDNY